MPAQGWRGRARRSHPRLRRGRPFVDALLFSAVWLLAELARGSFLTGFPWVLLGYSQASVLPVASTQLSRFLIATGMSIRP